jgi:Uncharacterized conserved protein
MKLDSTFVVPAPSAQVMTLLLDAPTMRACIPGCQELVQQDDRNYVGRLVNEVAHVRFNAAFSAEITERDEHEIRAILRGEDKKLASSLKLDATLAVVPKGDSSDVSYTIEMAMWGKLGRMGESIFRRRTAEVEKQFVEAFTQACRAQQEGVGTPEPAVAGAVGTAPVTLAPTPIPVDAAPTTPAPIGTPTGAGRRRQDAGGSGFWHRLIALIGRWSGRR